MRRHGKAFSNQRMHRLFAGHMLEWPSLKLSICKLKGNAMHAEPQADKSHNLFAAGILVDAPDRETPAQFGEAWLRGAATKDAHLIMPRLLNFCG